MPPIHRERPPRLLHGPWYWQERRRPAEGDRHSLHREGGEGPTRRQSDLRSHRGTSAKDQNDEKQQREHRRDQSLDETKLCVALPPPLDGVFLQRLPLFRKWLGWEAIFKSLDRPPLRST